MRRLLCILIVVLLLFGVAGMGFGSINEFELPLAGVVIAPASEVGEVQEYGVNTLYALYCSQVLNNYDYSVLTMNRHIIEMSKAVRTHESKANGGVAVRLIFPYMESSLLFI